MNCGNWLLTAIAAWLVAMQPILAAAADLEQEAREILTRRCLGCHSPQAKASGLDLSSLATALRGGTQGPALKPGSVEKSLLIARVASGQMPPSKPLAPSEQATLRRWVEAGAPWTGGAIAARRAGADWWSLQPLRVAPVPGVDYWVRRKLSAEGLGPAPPADRSTLIRRVTFDLTGLPPNPEEIAAFAADGRPDAYERLIDRLLASPHYGEQWARHWLDVVRYSESEGFERDELRDHVWPYRDYVIRSFNQDKPYAQFVREQLAGDVIEPSTRDGVSASTLLAMGPFDAVGITSAIAQERVQVRADQMEELVGVVAQTFLGLTVNCARCHDHKFDPIPQRDYYRMQAVFDSVWQPVAGEDLKADGRPLLTAGERSAHEAQVKAILDQIGVIEAKLGALDRAARTPRVEPKNVPAPVARWTFDTDARDDIGSLHASSPSATPEFREGRLQPAAGKDSVSLTTPRLEFDLREKTIEAWIFASKAPEKSATPVRILNHSGYRGAANDAIQYVGGKKKQWENDSTVRFRSEDVDGPPEDAQAGSRIHMAITYATDGEIRIYRNGQLYGNAYRPDQSILPCRLQTYGKGDAVVRLNSANGLELEEARLYGEALSAEQIAASFAAGIVNAKPAAGEERARLAEDLVQARQALAKIPEPAKVFAPDIQAAPPTRILLRGDANRPGEVVTPGAPSIVKGWPGDLGLPADAPDAARRRGLAEWIANPANPLPYRVIVNRIWHYHFGAGLVDSPNDFGFNGGEPTHPELLDWLATEFIRSGGSFKTLHKLILTSETYKRSSRFDATAAAKDAGARLLWRFPPQRLPGEAVRDAMLAASGVLNSTMYGPSFRPFQIAKNTGSYRSYEPVDSAAPELQRRTVYRMNVNTGGNPMLDALDCPLPSIKTPKRSTTTTPLQALSLMNNPFVDRMATALAARVTSERPGSAAQQIDRAFQLVLGRTPRPEETASGEEMADQAGLAALCWALFNSSEFLYVQ